MSSVTGYYNVRPSVENKFKPTHAKKLIQRVVTEELSSNQYNDKTSQFLTKQISKALLNKLKELKLEKYKFIVQAFVGEQRGQGIKIMNRCSWDCDTDSYATETIVTKSVASEEQQKILNATLNHPIVMKYPPSVSYRKLFLRRIMSLIEQSEDNDFCESLTEHYAQLIAIPSHDHQKFSYLSHILRNDDIVTVKESNLLCSDGTTGLRCWSAAKKLAQWCCDNTIISGKSVLELGSGNGLMGIVIAKMCDPSMFTFSDHHSAVLKLLVKNVSINLKDIKERVKIFKIDWELENCLDHYLMKHDPDIILGADVIFYPQLTVKLCRVINNLLCNRKDRVCYIACTVRNEETIGHFRNEICQKYKLQITEVTNFQNACDFIFNFNTDNFDICKLFKITI